MTEPDRTSTGSGGSSSAPEGLPSASIGSTREDATSGGASQSPHNESANASTSAARVQPAAGASDTDPVTEPAPVLDSGSAETTRPEGGTDSMGAKVDHGAKQNNADESRPHGAENHDGAHGDDEAGGDHHAGDNDENEWWNDPGMPWRHKPTRTDFIALGWLGFVGVFGLALLPIRTWLLGLNPPVLVSLTGSRTGSAAMGALASVGEAQPWWIAAVISGTLMSIKFDWVFWWAGALWGRGMIEVWAGRSERASRLYARTERWAEKWGALGMFLAYLPIPLPIMQVVFVLAGASGWSWKKFMVLDFFAAMAWIFIFASFGYAVGEPAVRLLRAYADISQWIALGLVGLIVITSIRSARKRETHPSKASS